MTTACHSMRHDRVDGHCRQLGVLLAPPAPRLPCRCGHPRPSSCSSFLFGVLDICHAERLSNLEEFLLRLYKVRFLAFGADVRATKLQSDVASSSSQEALRSEYGSRRLISG